jgi:hypothetical protein
MRSTYINRSGKLLKGVAAPARAALCAIALCATICLALGAGGAAAATRHAHADVPKGVQLIYVTLLSARGGSITTGARLQTHNYVLTAPATLKSVISQVDGLGTVPDRSYACPMFVLAYQPKLTLIFRSSANGAALAEIQVNVSAGPHHDSGDSPCSPIHFWVRGKAQPALLSSTFVASIGRMISADIS